MRELIPSWTDIEVGDESPSFLYEVTAEKIVGYSRAARYENLAYTSQAGAREMGLPGMIAPPAMVFVYAPVNLAWLAAAKSQLVGDAQSLQSCGGGATSVEFHGPLVSPGDVITSVTKVVDKSGGGPADTLTLKVSARNQRGELVAEYTQIYRGQSYQRRKP